MKETKAEIVNIQDPETKETKIYVRFSGNGYKDKERFILITSEEFNALVKLFVEEIVATAKDKNEKGKGGSKDTNPLV